LRGVRVAGAHGLGIAVYHGKVHATGLQVSQVAVVEQPKFRSHLPVLADAGADIALAGGWLHGSPVGVGTDTGKARVVGTLLDGGGGAPGPRDYGAFAMLDGSLDLEAVRVFGTGGAGVVANQAGLRIVESAVLAVPQIHSPKPRKSPTDPVEFTDLGDGVVGYQTNGLHVERSLVALSGRAGVLVDGCKTSVLQHSLVFGGSLGLAWQQGPVPAGEVQAVFGNSVQNRIGDQGLELPVLPGVVKP
jgi:hypothetical protein